MVRVSFCLKKKIQPCMVVIFDIFYLLLLFGLSYVVNAMVIYNLKKNKKKYRNGIMVGYFFAKNRKIILSHGKAMKTFFWKTW